jgi:hypothetical protein
MAQPTLPSEASDVRLIDGGELRAALTASAAWLDRHVEAINALNVFPVPDGDTGLNMSLTLRAAVDEMAGLSTVSLREVSAALAHGALMGARGNSGVILAQLVRGIGKVLADHDALDAQVAAAALAAGADAAYEAVAQPVEGTILTVARAAAVAAGQAAAETSSLIATIEHAHLAARDAVIRTPDQLPILRQAGVVDAGGEGYRVILEGLLLYVRGEQPSEAPIRVDTRADLSALHQDTDDFYGYCTEVLFRGAGLDPAHVRRVLEPLGTCILVVGDAELLKVHVHTLRPGAVLDLATDMGELVRVKVDNMQMQREQFGAGQGNADDEAPAREPGTALVAVALGAGFERIFASLGAVVVTGAGTMNPSVQQILAAVERAPRDDVVIAANDPNVVLAARQAANELAPRRVIVLPTRSQAQGIAAALALSPEADVGANLPRLEAAAQRCHVVEIARAARDATLGDVDIKMDAAFALYDGDAVAADTTYAAVLAAALTHATFESIEVATVYWGANGNAAEAGELAELARAQTGAAEMAVEFGGQPQFDYVICLE